ncbi:hypothetical protein C7121_27010 [Paenibacillus glucanolyticus]|nr:MULTISPECIES: hypothetical protein [Paenibacillus]AVV59519.1 hypothetical protein C7121_27010 [Paenibacillus glucanolyticus]ETT42194.1 hypothetical protein C169_05547 [Paenibacillus sp. FSL R5-808]MPY20584.1 hypothetical protein [Paenibacillus glucanolyticus]
MLHDLEVKLLKILITYQAHRSRVPTLRLLKYLTGRKAVEILEGIESLERHGYIRFNVWRDMQSLIVLEEELLTITEWREVPYSGQLIEIR